MRGNSDTTLSGPDGFQLSLLEAGLFCMADGKCQAKAVCAVYKNAVSMVTYASRLPRPDPNPVL